MGEAYVMKLNCIGISFLKSFLLQAFYIIYHEGFCIQSFVIFVVLVFV